MAVHKLMSAVREALFEEPDELVDSWAISSNPKLIFAILCTYWMFVYKIGPTFMRDRKPYDPKRTIQLYNAVQVLVCIGMVIWPFTDTDITKSVFSFGCSNCLPRKSEKYYAITRYAWWYLMIKLVDLLDTVFFVLRRKQNQITFLHIYHHISVVVFALVYVRYIFGEHVSILAWLNSLVHVFMYGYYFLAALGPEMQKRLWWKKYITSMQLLQFVIVLFVMASVLVRNCDVNKTTSILSAVYVAYYIYLFGNFYKRSYTTRKSPPVVDKAADADVGGVEVKAKLN